MQRASYCAQNLLVGLWSRSAETGRKETMTSLQWTDDPSNGIDSTHGALLGPINGRLNGAKAIV